MKLAQSSAVYFNYSIKYAIQDLHDLGYQGIEIWGGRPHMYRHDLEHEMDEIINLLNKLNMKVCNFIPAQYRYPSLLCTTNEKIRQDSVEYIKIAMDNALQLGSPSVSLCPGMVLFDEDRSVGWKQLVKSFKEIEEYNSDKHLLLLIEPAHKYESNLILTVEDGLRMMDELKSNQFGILLDVGHAHVNGEDFADIIPKCKGVPLHIHIDDNNGDFDAHWIPGKGTVNFESLFNALNRFGYDGFLSTELGPSYILDPAGACRETMEFLKKIDK